MTTQTLPRRTLLQAGSAAFTGYCLLRLAGPASAFPQLQDGEVIPWLDQPEPNPVPEAIMRQLTWEDLDTWITPNAQFFVIKHFDLPELDPTTWRLAVDGLVEHPLSLTQEDLKARARQEAPFTIECSGNSAFPFNKGLVGNAVWAGAPLADLLDEAGVQAGGIEVVFWGADGGEQTWREVTVTEQFARSMSLADARSPDNLLAYEMNGEPLPPLHGAPLRLIAPGWYGIANVKWLTRIEVLDRRYMGHFMARDYVTIPEEEVDGQTVWTFTSVGRARLKSAPAKVTRQGAGYQLLGAAWGAPLAGVEVRLDDGPWQPATLLNEDDSPFTWSFWTLDWPDPTPGEHTVTSRAIGADGEVQPAPDDPFLTGKSTYWESTGQITRQILIP
ncbi:MAG: sulfite oxidase [Thermomicrobiales bacterium]|nr:sulfite oxidase [Thermomicrobiales bacterium]